MEFDRDDRFDVDEIDVDEDEDLQTAMRDALEAVEAAGELHSEPGSESRSGEEVVGKLEARADKDGSEEEMEMLRREVAELRDRSVRTLADFDNFRKRVERERRDRERYAGSDILRDVLEVVDNLERALASSGERQDLHVGVELILKQVFDLLSRHGVERIESEGKGFDPSLHEAVSRQESSSVSTPTVAQELQSGFVIKDRLLRPAMVVVSVPKPPATDVAQDD